MTQASPRGSEIVVIGGGMIGVASALRLQQAGAQVLLVDPGDARARASFGNAGHICTELSEPEARLSNLRTAIPRLYAFGGPLDFRARDIDLWLPWSLRYIAACAPSRFRAGTAALSALQRHSLPAWRRLASDVGRPDLLEEIGYMGLWEGEAAERRGVAALAGANLGPAVARPLDADERELLAHSFPGKALGGVYFENTAKLRDPGATVEALWTAFEAAGGETRIGKAASIDTRGASPVVHLADGERIGADRVLIAAGARSAALMKQVGLFAPLIAERGYHLQFPEARWPQGLSPILFQDRWIFLTRFDSGVRATSFAEFARPDTPPDPGKWATLRRRLRDLGAPVEGEGIEWMGCRPSLPDFLPAIGRAERGVLYAFGHQHIGITLAAATAEAVLGLAGGQPVPERLKPFDIRRFA